MIHSIIKYLSSIFNRRKPTLYDDTGVVKGTDFDNAIEKPEAQEIERPVMSKKNKWLNPVGLGKMEKGVVE